MTKNFKRGAVMAASAAAILSMTIATPSFAKGHGNQNHGQRGAQFSNSANTNQVERPVRPIKSTPAFVAATVTSVPSSVTVVRDASIGGTFIAYPLAADATALPSTQPTTGGEQIKVSGVSLTNGVLTGNIRLIGGAPSSTSKFAVYNTNGVGALVTVTVDASGISTATASAALSTSYVAPVKQAKQNFGFAQQDGGQKQHGRQKMGRGPIGIAPLASPAQ
jgi:hypothetical protein